MWPAGNAKMETFSQNVAARLTNPTLPCCRRGPNAWRKLHRLVPAVPSSQSFSRSASKYTIGYIALSGRCRHCSTSACTS